MRRVILFISSYIPLYILLVLKNILERVTDGGRFVFSIKLLKDANFFDEINDYAIIALCAMSLFSYIYLKTLTKKNTDMHYYQIVHIEDQTGNVYFNYISIYLLSCLGLTLNSIVDVFILIFLMILVGYIYILNHMTYMNPVLQFMGYKIFEGEIKSKSTNKVFQSIIIVKKGIMIELGELYKGSGKEDFITISNRVDSTVPDKN